MGFLSERVKQCLPQSVACYIKNCTHNYINNNTGLRLYYRLERLLKDNPEINALFPYKDMIKHYVYEPARQTKEYPDVYVNQIRYYRIYQFFKERFPEVLLPEILVADIGDTSGVLSRVMRREGLSVNINPDVVTFIRQAGLKAQVGDVENMKIQKRGTIVNVTSVGVKYGSDWNNIFYSASKSGLEAVTRTLAREGAPFNILVNSVRPGVTETSIHVRLGRNMAKRRQLISLRRLARPSEIASEIYHLSAENTFITNGTIAVAGGE